MQAQNTSISIDRSNDNHGCTTMATKLTQRLAPALRGAHRATHRRAVEINLFPADNIKWPF